MKIDIDRDSYGLLNNIFNGSPKEYELLLCTIAQSDNWGSFTSSNKQLPTFYTYHLDKTPTYLKGKGIMGNVPGVGSEEGIITRLQQAKAERVINENKWSDKGDMMFWLAQRERTQNTTTYDTAESVRIYRSKAQEFIDEYKLRFLEDAESDGQSQPDKNNRNVLPIRFEGTTLYLYQPSGKLFPSVNFESSPSMFWLMDAIVKGVEKYSEIEHGWLVAKIPQAFLISTINKFYNQILKEGWIRNTKSNIKKHKITEEMSKVLVMSDYRRDIKGYEVKIKIQSSP